MKDFYYYAQRSTLGCGHNTSIVHNLVLFSPYFLTFCLVVPLFRGIVPKDKYYVVGYIILAICEIITSIRLGINNRRYTKIAIFTKPKDVNIDSLFFQDKIDKGEDIVLRWQVFGCILIVVNMVCFLLHFYYSISTNFLLFLLIIVILVSVVIITLSNLLIDIQVNRMEIWHTNKQILKKQSK